MASPIRCGDASSRLFAGWTMRDDPVLAWMWTREELRLRQVAALPAGEVRQAFVRLARQTHLG
jgi:hypothetical protein